MKPVDQTTFGAPGGNCLSACIASLLELPIEEVPYFGPPDRIGTREEWGKNIEQWLNPRGFYSIMFPHGLTFVPPGFHILSGMSPRGVRHSVVAHGERTVHDPHPSRGGLVLVEDVTLLVPLDPKQAMTELRPT